MRPADGAVTLALAQRVDHGVWHVRRRVAAGFDDTDDAGASADVMRFQLDPDEAVAGKVRRQEFDAAVIPRLIPADARQVDFEAE